MPSWVRKFRQKRNGESHCIALTLDKSAPSTTWNQGRPVRDHHMSLGSQRTIRVRQIEKTTAGVLAGRRPMDRAPRNVHRGAPGGSRQPHENRWSVSRSRYFSFRQDPGAAGAVQSCESSGCVKRSRYFRFLDAWFWANRAPAESSRQLAIQHENRGVVRGASCALGAPSVESELTKRPTRYRVDFRAALTTHSWDY